MWLVVIKDKWDGRERSVEYAYEEEEANHNLLYRGYTYKRTYNGKKYYENIANSLYAEVYEIYRV